MVDIMVWFAGAFFTIVILGLLVYLIKGWFEAIKKEFEKAVEAINASIKQLTAEIGRLFERSESDRLGRVECQRQAQATYATKTELTELEKRVTWVERRQHDHSE